MHELGVTEHLLSLVLKYANEAGATQVTGLNLVIGELSSVVDDSVAMYWELLAKDTIAEGATLNIERIPGTLRCRDCGETFSLAEFEVSCPNCGGLRGQVVDGDQFQLKSIDVESPDVKDH
jgi:hydrogenase nickel incorporation protein HypA/HybF